MGLKEEWAEKWKIIPIGTNTKEKLLHLKNHLLSKDLVEIGTFDEIIDGLIDFYWEDYNREDSDP